MAGLAKPPVVCKQAAYSPAGQFVGQFVWPEHNGELAAVMQQLTNTHAKRWKPHRHEIGFGHLHQGRYQSFPVETDDYFYQIVRIRNVTDDG